MATFMPKSLCNSILPVIASELGGIKRDDVDESSLTSSALAKKIISLGTVCL